MAEFFMDVLVHVVFFNIGAIFLRAATFGRYRLSPDKSNYPYAIAFLGFALSLSLFILIVTWSSP